MLPPEIFTEGLSHPEFRLLVSLYHLKSPVGAVEATMEEIKVLTGMSPESQRVALRGLESAGLVVTRRTKRNLGRLSRNSYNLPWAVSPPQENRGWSQSPPQESRGSTGDYVVPGGTSRLSSKVSRTSNKKDTTYLLVDAVGDHEMKEVIVSTSQRWKARGEDTSGDDAIAGFGLFEDELPVEKSQLSISKRDTKTRGRRPEHDWTVHDVAAEFSFQVGKRFPYLPGLVNVKDLRGALSRYRKQFKLNASIEMELMRMFFEDPNNLKDADKSPQYLHAKYLKTFKTHTNRALERLGLETEVAVPTHDVAPDDRDEYVYSSDGRAFDNTIVGRKKRDRHEERLGGRV